MEVYYQPDILSGSHELSVEESKHCIKVMRHERCDTIHVADGRGTLFEVRIDEPNAKKCTFQLVSLWLDGTEGSHCGSMRLREVTVARWD